MHKKRVVIVGGGFGGVKTALELAKRRAFDVTLVSDDANFTHHATLYSTVIGRSRAESIIPLRTIFAGKNVRIIQDTATSIDTDRKFLICENGIVEYDILVVSVGSEPNFFAMPGVQKYSYSLRDTADIVRLHAHLHDELADDKFVHKKCVVVGAGPAGIELAGALCEYIDFIKNAHQTSHAQAEVFLIESSDQVLPGQPPEMSRPVAQRLRKLGATIQLNECVVDQTRDQLVTDQAAYATDTVIWTTGTRQNSFFAHLDDVFAYDAKGRVIVDAFLTVSDDIYVIGDNAATPLSGLATNAVDNAIFVARDIIARDKDLPRTPYVSQPHSFSVPVDDDWAIIKRNGEIVTGVAGMKLRRASELKNYRSLLDGKSALHAWKARNKIEDDCDTCTEFFRKKRIVKR